MSSLIKSQKLVKLCLRSHPLLFTAVRNHWNKDFKPGPHPRTDQERLRAAEKYNLHPAEYEVYPDDGSGLGDYPKLPEVGHDEKDPYYPWDNPELKRNFNEPLHAEFDLMREDRYNVSAKLRYPLSVQWLQFLGALGGAAFLIFISEQLKMFHPLTPPQYPNDGVTHYTFEPANE